MKTAPTKWSWRRWAPEQNRRWSKFTHRDTLMWGRPPRLACPERSRRVQPSAARRRVEQRFQRCDSARPNDCGALAPEVRLTPASRASKLATCGVLMKRIAYLLLFSCLFTLTAFADDDKDKSHHHHEDLTAAQLGT